MQKKFKLQRKDSVASSWQSHSQDTHKEVSRNIKGDTSHHLDFSITPLSGFRDITNLTYGDSSLNLQNVKKNLETAKLLVKRNKQELRKNYKKAKSFDDKVKKSRVSSAKAELQSIKSEFTEKNGSDESEMSNKSSKLRFSQKALGFKGQLIKNKSTKSDDSKGDPITKVYPQSQPAKNILISDDKINSDLKKAAMIETSDIYKINEGNEADKVFKRRFTEAVQTTPQYKTMKKRGKPVESYSRKIKRREILNEYQKTMTMGTRLVKITLPLNYEQDNSNFRTVERIRYPRLLMWLNERVIEIGNNNILLKRVPL